jgi:hypothetical protein
MPAPPGEPTPIAGQGYELVFEDDFDTLDRSIWSPPPWHGVDWPSGHVVASSSILTVTADLSFPRPYEEVWSLGPQDPGIPRYPNALAWEEGYFEVRARVTNDPWTKLALWFNALEGANYFGGTRPCDRHLCEWDMVENGGRAGFAGPTAYADLNHVTVQHRNTGGTCGVPDVAASQTVNGTDLCNWHVWGGRWTPTTVESYLDGVRLTTGATPDTFAQPMPFIISSAPLNYTQAMITQWGIPAAPAFIITEVDWFRVWQQPKNAKRSRLLLPGTSGAYATTPHHSSLQITGDLDVRCEFDAANPTPAGVNTLVNRANSGNWSFQFALRSNGVVRLGWSADGSATLAADSAVLPIVPGKRIIVRATLDVDNGASQRVITFYTAPTRQGPWTQLSQVTQAGVTSIFAGTRALEFGTRAEGTLERLTGSLYWAEVRNGIDGQVVARFDPSDKTPGMTTFTDETGKIYTIMGDAKIMPGNPATDLYVPVSPQRLA